MHDHDTKRKEESEGNTEMNYFCDVHVQSRKDQERRIFIILDQKLEGTEQPHLTKEILLQNIQYRDFCQTYKPKLVMVDYVVYATDAEIYAGMQDDAFEKLIADGMTERIAQSELQVDAVKDKAAGGKKRRKLTPPMLLALIGGVLLLAVIALGAGMKLGRNSAAVEETTITLVEAPNEYGMLIPEQNVVDSNSEQITVSIDRSYAAVPTEDLQIKGTVIKGLAAITLPEFDRTDFFTHVRGYTWGFSTDPNAEKIEYYGGQTYSFSKDTKLYRVLVKYGGGSGTKDDPYLINYYDQLELLSEEQARGYFLQTEDITFPDWENHTPINTVNELKADPDAEYFEYDGGGYTISNLQAPLFGKISGAVIRNVNVTNSRIDTEEYSNCGFICSTVYNYRYKAEDGTQYETGETLIKHCSVSHSAIYMQHPQTEEATEEVQIITAPTATPPDLIEYDEDGNPIEPQDATEPEIREPSKSAEFAVGSLTGLGGQIEDCYVNDFGIYAYLDDYILYAGGISGKPANVVNSAVFFFSAQGNIFYGGGICGSAGGARYHNAAGREMPSCYGGSIQGCTARLIYLTPETASGGIVGEAGTDAEGAMIANCYANSLNITVGIYEDSKVKKPGAAGGIIGMDGNEKNGHLITGCVSPVELSVIGKSVKSSFDDTVRLAPAYAFYQENILSVINRNTVLPDSPKEIFSGSFKFGDAAVYGDASGALPYPESIEDLFAKTNTEGSTS